MNKYQQKHIIILSSQQERLLEDIIKKGKHLSCVIKRARVLLKSAHGQKDNDIAKDVLISVRTIENIRARYTEGGIDRALYDAPRSGQPPKINDKIEAYLVATACSNAPEGYDHWTLELLQKQLIKDRKLTKISTVAIWEHLRQRGIKPWREKNVDHSHAHA